MKFIAVDPKAFPDLREGRRGRVSYPILKSFLETGLTVAKLDRTGMQQSLQSLNSSLGAYVRSHNLPIRIANRGGEVYLIRTDADDKGEVTPKSVEEFARPYSGVVEVPVDGAAKPITPEEVRARFDKEKGQVTK